MQGRGGGAWVPVGNRLGAYGMKQAATHNKRHTPEPTSGPAEGDDGARVGIANRRQGRKRTGVAR